VHVDRETGPEPPATSVGGARAADAGQGRAADAGQGRAADAVARPDLGAAADPAAGAAVGTLPSDGDEAADLLDDDDDAPEAETAGASWQVRRVGFPSRVIMAQLAADPRVPIWARRAVGVVVLAVGFSFWLGWRYGLTIAAVAAIIDTVYQSKTMSLIPAAARVAFAQRRTRHRLLLLRPFGYHALHIRLIPGTESIIDHLVVGPGGVFALDAERWDRRLPVRTVASNSAAGPVLYHGPFSQKDRLAHARWEAAQATHLLSREMHRQVTVRPAMVIYGPGVPWTVAKLRGVDVFSGRSVVRYFASRTRTKRDPAMSWQQVGEIVAAAERALPRR
jgi:Nuclease-related domain